MAEVIMHPILVREKVAQWVKGRHGYLNLYRCKCGNEFAAQPRDVDNGKSRTCGCGRHCKRSHGMSGHPLYWVHKSMLARCCNPKCQDYKNYGGRGINVCDEWKNDRNSFFHWAINSGWAKGLLIDRIDVNGDYQPSNCRFVTPSVSGANKRECFRKLTSSDVAEMRAMRDRGEKIRDIANGFRVAYNAAWKTLNGINHSVSH